MFVVGSVESLVRGMIMAGSRNITLFKFWAENEMFKLWVSGVGIPGGRTYFQNLEVFDDYCDLRDVIHNGLSLSPLWNMCGNVVEDGSWVWNGEGDFRDVNGSNLTRMQVFPKTETKDEK
jgi:hypothetical protein